MAQTIRRACLALLGALVLNGVAVQAAQAAPQFTAWNTEAEKHEGGTITGKSIGLTLFRPTAGASPLTCEEEHFHSGTETGTATTLTVLPTYGKCHVGELNADVRMNGCHYLFHVKTTIAMDTSEGSTDIVCSGTEGGKGPIEIEVTTATGGQRCLITIPSQEGIGPVLYHNETATSPTDVIVTIDAENVTNETNQGILNCGVAKGHHATGVVDGDTTWRAFNGSEKQIDFTVNDA